MSDPAHSHTSDNYLFDVENATEMARLINLDRLLTNGAGGPLAGLPPLREDAQVLDVACGPGGWVLDVAYSYPKADVIGIDLSTSMIAYAHARAQSQGLNNASFGVMNILQPLDFADQSFDLVNARQLILVLQPQQWPPVLAELARITRPGGIIRLTENDEFGLTNSPAYEAFKTITYQALKSRYGFSVDGRNHGITFMLGRLLQEAGCEQVKRSAYVIDFSADQDAWADIYTHTKVITLEAEKFLTATGLISPERFHELFQQMQTEMTAPNFCGTLTYQSAWGVRR